MQDGQASCLWQMGSVATVSRRKESRLPRDDSCGNELRPSQPAFSPLSLQPEGKYLREKNYFIISNSRRTGPSGLTLFLRVSSSLHI